MQFMTAKLLIDALKLIESWPQEAQEELAAIAFEMDAELSGRTFHATPAELQGIDRGLVAARAGRFATDEEVETTFAKHRRS
jgi:hypothetical protein